MLGISLTPATPLAVSADIQYLVQYVLSAHMYIKLCSVKLYSLYWFCFILAQAVKH